MRITELINENTQVDEISLKGIGQGLGKAAGAVGGAVGGVQGAWAGMKNAYGQQRDRAAPVAQRNVQRAGGYKAPAAGMTTAPAPQTTGSTGGADPAELRQQATDLNRQADQIERSQQASPAAAPTSTPAQEPAGGGTSPVTATATPGPAGTTYDPAKAAADKLAKGQADQQLAQQQMKATADANAAKSAEDAQIKAAADAAKAKSGFQQTAADKLAIKAAADKGIREAKKRKLKKKVVAEFRSNFLGMVI